MKKILKWVGIVLGTSLILLLILPLIIAIPPLDNIKTIEQLADPDSRFIVVEGLKVHYKIQGGKLEAYPETGLCASCETHCLDFTKQTALILLHGFGASTFSWREVIEPLAEDYVVLAYDRPAFGLTERPLMEDWTGPNPYAMEFQDDLLVKLMDNFNLDQAVLVGNSMGGTVAFWTALEHPERVRALILVDPAFAITRSTGFQKLLFQLPQVQRLGPWLVRSISKQGDDILRRAWHDPSKIGEDVYIGYRKPLQAPNWDIALWELTMTRSQIDLLTRADEIRVPVLVITGDDDRIVPTQETIKAAERIPNAKLVIIKNCGHVPQEECPEAFLEAVNWFLDEMGGK